MNAKSDLVTFEQAMRSTGRESIQAYGEHVNPVEAHLLRLMGIDRRYTRAEGMYLHDDRGGSCLDFTAGYGALPLGHNPPEVLDAVRQAQALPSVLLIGVNPLMGALGANLGKLLPEISRSSPSAAAGPRRSSSR